MGHPLQLLPAEGFYSLLAAQGIIFSTGMQGHDDREEPAVLKRFGGGLLGRDSQQNHLAGGDCIHCHGEEDLFHRL